MIKNEDITEHTLLRLKQEHNKSYPEWKDFIVRFTKKDGKLFYSHPMSQHSLFVDTHTNFSYFELAMPDIYSDEE